MSKQNELTPENIIEKSVTCDDEEYLEKLVLIRAQVIEALNSEKKLKRQIDTLTEEYKKIKPKNALTTDKYIELSKRRYTFEYIDEMISNSSELYIERHLIDIRSRIQIEGYSYELVESLITYDNLLIKATSESVNTEKACNDNEMKENKYKKSIFRKAYLSLIGGIVNEDD